MSAKCYFTLKLYTYHFKRTEAAFPMKICIRHALLWNVIECLLSSMLNLPGNGREDTQQKAHRERDLHHGSTANLFHVSVL